jgi:hypothetical protein
MQRLKIIARTLINLALFPAGALGYARTGRTAHWAHMALVQLFCASGGRFNDLLTRLIAWRSRPLQIEQRVGVLGDMSGPALEQCTQRLRDEGYIVFPAALSTQACERLMRFALHTPATIRRMDHETHDQPLRVALFDPDKPLAVRYDYPTDALLDDADVQALLADPSLLALAQSYLGSRPRADVLSMWWHTGFHTQPDSEAAQFYHFDMDRIKWFKIFVYLTDVTPADGPHSFIEGSHRTGGIPTSMLRKGYVRLQDAEVLGHYGPQREVEFAAPRGTIIVEDTRGLHKGKAVSGSPRLVLQLQFSNSLFGGNYPKATMRDIKDARLARLVSQAPDVYASYL